MERLKVLVVDQHEGVCHILARSLARMPGIEVISDTPNVMRGAELARELSPDVVLVDFKWGEATRSDIVRWMARMSPGATLVVHSSYYTEGEREAFRDAGAAACLLKGITARELAARLQDARAGKYTRRLSNGHAPFSVS